MQAPGGTRGAARVRAVEAIIGIGTKLLARAERLIRAALIAAKHDELSGIVFWATLIGVAGAFAGVSFRAMLRLVEQLMTGDGADLVEAAQLLPWWSRIAVPMLGGAIAGTLLWAGGRFLPTRSVDFMEAAGVGDGRISSRASLLRTASSFFSIGSGASVGREGPMVQLAATFASKIGQLSHAPVTRLRLLAGCGAAAGIATAYNAPIAGALFVAEIVLGSIATESLGPLIVSSVVADATARHFFGYGPIYHVPHTNFGATWELVLYIVLGVLLGHAAPTYLALLERARQAFRGLQWPMPVTLALGGLLVGIISVRVPQVWGGGHSVVNLMLSQNLPVQMLAIMLAAKVLATAASAGSGASGGILTPTLFLGAAFGTLFGHFVHVLDPHSTSQFAAYAVVGMGAFLAATTHAPLTSILLIFEMTLSYDVVLPLILACVTGHYVARIYRRGESVYTRSLRARGRDTPDEWRPRQIDALIRQPDVVLRREQPVSDVLERPPASTYVYVVDSQHQLVGLLDVSELLRQSDSQPPARGATVGQFMQAAPNALVPEMLLGDALNTFIASHAQHLPVVSGHWSPVLVGEVSRHDVMAALRTQLTDRGDEADSGKPEP